MCNMPKAVLVFMFTLTSTLFKPAGEQLQAICGVSKQYGESENQVTHPEARFIVLYSTQCTVKYNYAFEL